MEKKKSFERLIEAIEDYKAETNKVDYVFTQEEYVRLYKEIHTLEKHLELMADYEDKR